MSFGIINWSILILLVIGITWLGHRLSAGQKGLDGFFLGGNSLPWWAVSGSIMATQISAVTIIALPGAVFQEGGNLLFLQGTLLGFVIAKILMTLLFVGPYYEKKIYSPYDFIGNRLGQRAAHLTRGLFLAGAILGHGVRLLTVSLVLSVIVDLSIGQSILFIGLFSIAWSIMGGITTVIWTDLIMFVIMVGGAIISIVTIAQGLPIGLSEAVAELDASAKLRLFDLSADPARTWTVWTGIICFTVFELAQNSVDQVVTQRMMCCKNPREARKAVLGSLGIVLFSLLMTLVGLGIWLFYRHQPPDAEGAAFLAAQPSRAYPYFVFHELPEGISGLIVAGIFAAGISTLNSALAALSETWVNGYYRVRINPEADEATVMRMSRKAIATWGLILCILAYVAGKIVQNEGLLNLAYKAPVVTYGPMLMVAIMALMRKTGVRAIIAAVAVSVTGGILLLICRAVWKLPFDEFWIYPMSCIFFLITHFISGQRKEVVAQS